MSGLLDGYDAVLLDLDGTVLRGSETVPEAPDVVNELRQAGCAVQFVTNNASRSPAEIAEHLTALGLPTAGAQVVTSAQAAVALLASQLAADAAVLVVGADALVAEVRSAGLRPVTAASDDPVAVVQGHSPDTGWARLAEACLVIRGGAMWVACNVDRTLPTERGLLPGNGAMVAALQVATDREPTVAGKPERALLNTAMERVGARRPLVVGDRLDTDIAGARAAELDSLLVLSGVADPAALLAAPPEQRPSHLGADLRVLRGSVADVRIQTRPGWRVDVADGRLLLRSEGTAGDPLDALRTLCAVWWIEHRGTVLVCACDDTAAAALDRVGLGEARRPAR
ncbi:MAG: HAD-IIA family hydrolase [Actinomycetota bacterium]|nr:HAD-IIA family hydrolase [Actinomycetota bacterium]